MEGRYLDISYSKGEKKIEYTSKKFKTKKTKIINKIKRLFKTTN